ncbi:PREDICTED: uncharacterized protein LOC105359714 [Ceratosolen solmsi marchali]|uniref:Uncharacterized protein LOC105359714 n=1 Tax=Ceratosolen solmsi marchali TaxID=326594 RepID=A0AAJ6YBS7_9HYME|nr:PREDICTED: uncharacterized protein LOC105359714 [Ceratosolen solmsi marchali]
MKLKKILETSFTLQPKEPNQKLEIYKCKYCGQTYARHITRMSVHLLKCSGCPGAVRELLEEKVKAKILESSKHGFNKKGQVRNLKKILEENFVLQPRNGTQKLDIFKCKHCEQKYARNASRMSLHLQKCSDCPEEVKDYLEMNVKENIVHKVCRKLIPKKLLESSFILQPKEPNQKLQTFKCKYCGQIYARHSTRMSMHLQKCIGCPGTIKESLLETAKFKREQRRNELNLKRRNSESEEAMSEDENNFGTIQVPSENVYFNDSANENNFIDRMSKQRQKYCEELLAKAIYASNAPVSIVDNDHWRTLLNTLSPAFQLPTQQQLSTCLLERTYENVKKSVDQKVRDAVSIGLQCSYRSNARNEGIIHFVLSTPDPVLYKSISLSTNVEDENLYLEKISEVIDEVGAERVLGVCLDSISTCENLWELLQQKYEEHNISFYNCSSQTLNHLLKDMSELPVISVLLKNASSIVKEIKQSHVLSSLLSEAQKASTEKNQNILSLKLPGIKRWNPSLMCLDSLLENKDNLQYLAFSSKGDKYISKVTKELISDEEFWAKINSYIKLIRPIIKWIAHLDDEEAKISEVPEIFVDLEQHFITEFQEPSLILLSIEESDQILKRFKTLSSTVLQPIHFAANILNPLFKGEHLSSSEFVQGTEIISKLSIKFGMPEDDILIDLANYNSGKGVWSVNFVKKSIALMPPSTWWKGFFKNSFLTKVAASILDLPSTSIATTDRSNKRNSLKDDPTGKIMYISQNLRLLDPKRNDKNNKYQEDSQERIEEEFMIEDIEVYNEDIEEVLVEDPEQTIEEAEVITGDSEEIREEANEEQNTGLYIQIVNDAGETFYVQQSVPL